MDAVERRDSRRFPLRLGQHNYRSLDGCILLAPPWQPAVLNHVPRALPFLAINFLPVRSHACLPCLLALTARSTSST